MLLVTMLVAGLAGAQTPSASPGRSADAETRVVQAAKKHDTATVLALIKQRADVNAPEGDGSTPLLWAAYWSDLDMGRALIAAGASVKAGNRLGLTPLLQASRLGDAAMIDTLLKAGADPSIAGPEGETPLMAASGAGKADAVRLLLARRVDVNAKEQWQGQTALMWASIEGHVQVVDALLKGGADPNVVAIPSALPQRPTAFRGRSFVDHASGGLTAVMFAARQGHFDVAKALADAGADLNHANPDSATALMIAIINDRYDLAGMLLDKGANADDGSLYQAVEMHNLTVEATTGEATRPRLDHPNKLTALDLIARLLDRGASPNKPFVHTLHFMQTRAPAPPNNTPFYRAAQAGDVAAIRLMLAKGADPNLTIDIAVARGNDSLVGPPAAAQTPLMAAMGGGGGRGGGPGGGGRGGPQFREPAERDPVESVKLMLAAGVDVNATVASGDTALHRAAQNGSVPMIRLLAERGAKLDAKNRAGLTPLDLAMGTQAPGGRGPGGGGGGGGRGGGGPQPQAIVLLRQLMGLPPLSPEEMPKTAPPAPRPF